MTSESRFKESLTSYVQSIIHGPSRFNLADGSHRRRFGKRCGRAVARPEAQENFRDADADTAQEETLSGQEITDPLANSKAERFANSANEKENISHANANSVTAPQKKGFANTNRNPRDIFNPNAFTERFAPSKEKDFTGSSAVRVGFGNRNAS
jgi:uncharacterized membrane protein